MSDQDLKDQLSDRLGPQVASNEPLLQECIKMCKLYNLSAEELQYKWEAFSFNGASRGLTIFTLESAALLKANIQRNLVNERIKKEKDRGPRNLSGITGAGHVTSRFSSSSKFGGIPKARLGGEPRSTSHSVSSLQSRVAFQCSATDEISRKKRFYKYMYEKISERSEVLDERIDEFAEIVRRHYKITEFSDPSAATEDRVHVIGRITLDAETSSIGAVKLNEASLVLETSRLLGSGARVPLKFHPGTLTRGETPEIAGAGFFPGTICAFKGKNGGGGWFLVDEILIVPSLARPESVKLEAGLGSFTMCIACGPFTTDADLNYKPWIDLVKKLKVERPAVLLLIGPFVDAFHPVLKSGDMEVTVLDIFCRKFRDHIADFLDFCPGSMAIVVPSVRDLVGNHAAYPQPEFTNDLFDDQRVHMVPNPCEFAINGINFAASSVDILFHLRKEEFFKSAATANTNANASVVLDPMANTCRHLLQQRSFYPIFPVPVDHASEVNLDVTHSELLQLGGDTATAPDVLIVPSRLKHFAKVIDGTTVVNPSTVSKGQYCSLSFDASASGNERLIVHNLKTE